VRLLDELFNPSSVAPAIYSRKMGMLTPLAVQRELREAVEQAAIVPSSASQNKHHGSTFHTCEYVWKYMVPSGAAASEQ
jgi:hypothetical protein